MKVKNKALRQKIAFGGFCFFLFLSTLFFSSFLVSSENEESNFDLSIISEVKTKSDSQNTSDFVYDVVRRRPSGTVIINQINAQITISNNLPQAKWTLLKNNVPVYNGQGSVINFQVIDGDNYRIVPENIPGYVVRVSPSRLNLYPARTQYVSIIYERTFGTLTIEAPFPENETVSISITPERGSPQVVKVKSKSGKIYWQSKPLPTGIYEISYTLPSNFPPAPTEKIVLKRSERLRLRPQLFTKGILHVVTNIPEAIFVLRSIDESNVWKGAGREYTFTGIPKGFYLLSFSSEDPQNFIPPKEMKISLNELEKKEIQVSFQISGMLTIKTNVDRSHVVIKEIGGQHRKFEENIFNHSKVFHLPQGRYSVTLSTFMEDQGTTANLSPPDPKIVIVKPFGSEELNLSFQIIEEPKEKQLRVSISTGIGNGKFSIYQVHDGGKELIGTFSGKSNQITLPSQDKYEVLFHEVPNFETPKPLFFEIKEGEEKNFQTFYSPKLSFIEVPSGKVIIGDPFSGPNINELPAKTVFVNAFSIGIYTVTNAEYATWLNEAIRSKTIAYINEADGKGQVVNIKNQLLFKTFESDPLSQISGQLQSTGIPLFVPIPGKDAHPVINVSWYGAKEYCKDHHGKLPTEAEWEKAAGMAIEKDGEPLKKFRYGFGRDKIDPSWANYKKDNESILYFKVLTTPVGFYNGVNVLPLSVDTKNQTKTNLAKSPYGAFDMSGNVWEWVSDWYQDNYLQEMSDRNPQGSESGTQKVVKGGCYDSLEDGVRVAERMGLPPDHCDAFTGFRFAM